MESAKAAAQTPTLTLMFIPASTEFQNPGYLKLICANTAYCKLVMRIPATKVRMEFQLKYVLNTSQQAKPTGDMLLVEIGNHAGFDQYSTARTDQAQAHFLAAVLQALNSTLPATARTNAATLRTYCTRAKAMLDNNKTPQQRTRAAAKVCKLPADTSMQHHCRANPTTSAVRTGSVSPEVQLAPLCVHRWQLHRPKHTGNEDGTLASQPPAFPSPEEDTNGQPAELPQRKKVPRIGAAVYVPPQQPSAKTGEKQVACLPSNEKYAYDDTINRTELAAAYKALAMQCGHIATDSLAALYQIHKFVTKPQDTPKLSQTRCLAAADSQLSC
jgi:hypothetical protein